MDSDLPPSLSIMERAWTPSGETLYINFQYYKPVHRGKKNGGPSYTQAVHFGNNVTGNHPLVFLSKIVVNMANPRQEILEQMIMSMDQGVMMQIPSDGE